MNPSPNGMLNRYVAHVGICSEQAIGAHGFSLLYNPPVQAYNVSVPIWWSGSSFNGLSTFGSRAKNGFSLFPDAQVSRLAIGVCMWWDGASYRCGVNVAQFEYEALTAQSGMLFPSIDVPPPVAPPGYTYGNSPPFAGPPIYPYLNGELLSTPQGFQIIDHFTPNVNPAIIDLAPGCPHPPPIRTYATYNPNTPTIPPNIYGSYSHVGIDEFEDGFGFGPYTNGSLFLPMWIRAGIWFPNETDPADNWFSSFGRFAIGANSLYLFFLQIGLN